MAHHLTMNSGCPKKSAVFSLLDTHYIVFLVESHLKVTVVSMLANTKMFGTLRFLPKKLCGTKVDVNRLSIFFTHITTYPCTEVQTV